MIHTAWETTEDDVFNVLNSHGVTSNIDDDIVRKCLDGLDHDSIVESVLHYSDMDDQSSACLKEVEKQLIEKGYIKDPPHF